MSLSYFQVLRTRRLIKAGCRWFAAEIIGNVLDVEPRRWRRPRREDLRMNQKRVEMFREKFEKFDWTKMLGR